MIFYSTSMFTAHFGMHSSIICLVLPIPLYLTLFSPFSIEDDVWMDADDGEFAGYILDSDEEDDEDDEALQAELVDEDDDDDDEEGDADVEDEDGDEGNDWGILLTKRGGKRAEEG